MKIVGNEVIFTKEEKQKINRLLEEGEEIQRQNGNRLYTDEEMWKPILGEEFYNKLVEEEIRGNLGELYYT